MQDNFAIRLLRAQTAARINTLELARRITTQPSTLYRLQRGSTLPHYDTLVAIARVLNVSTDYLCGLKDTP